MQALLYPELDQASPPDAVPSEARGPTTPGGHVADERTVTIIESIDQLRDMAPAWDDLWSRSDAKCPTFLAENVAMFCETFGHAQRFLAILVSENGRLVAALPMVKKRLRKILPSMERLQNEWAPGCEWMIDPACDNEAVADLVIKTVESRFPRQPLVFRAIESSARHWRTFLDAAQRAGYRPDVKTKFNAAWIQTEQTWEDYQKTLKKNHRSKMRKYNRRLAELGDVQFEMHTDLNPKDIPAMIREGFEVEDRSWKGRNGTSVLGNPSVADYYTRLACFLAQRGHLVLAFLRCDSKPVSFEFGFNGKGVYHSLKVGYDPEFAAFAPGQILMERILETMHNESGWTAMDCMGPINMAVAKWQGDLHSVDRVMLIPPKQRLLRLALGIKRMLRKKTPDSV